MSDYGYFNGGSQSPMMGSVSRMAMLARGFAATAGLALDAIAPLADYDFVNAVYQGSALTITRASVGYCDDLSGNWTQFAANTLRRTNKGLLVEESRTNLVVNNSFQGCVPGSPGTIANGMTANWGGLTPTVIGQGTENGIDYVEIRAQGVSTAALAFITLQANNVSAASPNQVLTSNFFIRQTGGTLAGVTGSRMSVAWVSGAGVQLGLVNGTSQTFSTASLGSQRNAHTYSAAPALTAFVQPRWELLITNASVIDITFRVGWPGLELGTTITSPIRTTGTSATRAAEVVSAPISGLGSGVTVAAIARPGPVQSGINQLLAVISESTLANALRIGRTSTQMYVSAVPPTVTAVHPNVKTTGVRLGLAAAFAANDRVMTTDGNASVISETTTGAFPPGMTTLYIGHNGAGATIWNGYIERLAVRPGRATNDNVISSSNISSWG